MADIKLCKTNTYCYIVKDYRMMDNGHASSHKIKTIKIGECSKLKRIQSNIVNHDHTYAIDSSDKQNNNTSEKANVVRFDSVNDAVMGPDNVCIKKGPLEAASLSGLESMGSDNVCIKQEPLEAASLSGLESMGSDNVFIKQEPLEASSLSGLESMGSDNVFIKQEPLEAANLSGLESMGSDNVCIKQEPLETAILSGLESMGSDNVYINQEPLETASLSGLESNAVVNAPSGSNNNDTRANIQAPPIHATCFDNDTYLDHTTGYMRNIVNNEMLASLTEKRIQTLLNSGDSANTQNDSYKFKTPRCYSNKRKEKHTNFIIDNDRAMTEEIDATLTVKQEDLYSALADALNCYSNCDAIIKTEDPRNPKSLETDYDKLDKEKRGRSYFRSNKADLKPYAKTSVVRSRINFEDDDENSATATAKLTNFKQVNANDDDIDTPSDCLEKTEQKASNTLYPCDQCDEQFAHKNSLNIHKLKHCGKMPYSCDICGNDYVNLSTFNDHKKRYHSEKKYACYICKKRFINEHTLKIHKESYHISLKFECEFCDKKFAIYDQLKRHTYVHTDEKRYSCIECDVYFRNYSSLSFHRQSVHLKIKSKCRFCKKTFSNRQSLYTHNKHTHSSFQGYSCKICKEVFRYQSTLQRHMGKHNGFAIKCNLCGKGFSFKYQLVRHELSHTGEKAFECDFCNNRFQKKESMRNHIVNRVCEKRPKPKKKSKKSSLKKRRMEKFYQCATCNREFNTKKYLITHVFECERKKRNC